ncbi:unnamed protein product, partial [Rotaria sp. Silwood1]
CSKSAADESSTTSSEALSNLGTIQFNEIFFLDWDVVELAEK